jgi:uncharacterized protein YdeI (YjbR/CyaY-like superfamily)
MPKTKPVRIDTLDLRKREHWRTWLSKHHASSPGIWFTLHKKHSGVTGVPYEDAVRDALCFGWIDSLVKRMDDKRFMLKFTPRKPESKWSDSNRRRWLELKAAGALAAPGLVAAPTENRYAPKPTIPVLPAYIARAFKANRKAWAFFQKLPPTARRHYIVWIHVAKRAETREKRLRASTALLASGKLLGLK